MPTSVEDLKKYFKKFNRPTEQHFRELIESMVHRSDGGFRLNDDGFVGIGTDDPQADLHLHEDGFFRIGLWEISQTGGGDDTSYLRIKRHHRTTGEITNLLALDYSGNLHLRRDVVPHLGEEDEMPDYVFAPDYELASLEELASFVENERHLPDIPTQEQVDQEGLNLGAFSVKLLKKIEELTLYVIQLKREIDELKVLNNQP